MIELRKESDGTAIISGTASRYGVWYRVGPFRERVMRGAATATLASSPTVLFTAEHDRSRAVARTPATLQLWENDDGLKFRATVDVANDSDARSLVSKVERGVYPEASFAFRVSPGGESWNQDRSDRTISAFDLDHGDVSVVPFGASPTTSATVERALFGTLAERRSLAAAVSSTGWCGPYATRAMRQVMPDVGGGYPSSGGVEPPNLRPASGGTSCGNCEFFDPTAQMCNAYSWDVQSDWLCDSWRADDDTEPDDDSDDYGEYPAGRAARRSTLVPNDSGDLLREVQRLGGGLSARIEREWRDWEREIVEAARSEWRR